MLIESNKFGNIGSVTAYLSLWAQLPKKHCPPRSAPYIHTSHCVSVECFWSLNHQMNSVGETGNETLLYLKTQRILKARQSMVRENNVVFRRLKSEDAWKLRQVQNHAWWNTNFYMHIKHFSGYLWLQKETRAEIIVSDSIYFQQATLLFISTA